MTIAPVIKTAKVGCPPDKAFDLFASRMATWWPKDHTTAKSPFHDIVVEPRRGGRWFERDAAGVETDWGSVLDWSPPGRLLLGWQLDSRFQYNADFLTELELTFAETADGGCSVTLEHRNLERYGADAERIAGLVSGGWGAILDNFAKTANHT